jgi:uncharacterized protein
MIMLRTHLADAVFLISSLSSPATSSRAEATAPPHTDREPGMANAVVQWQILAKDPDAVSAFYSTLFGWTVDRDNPMGYRRLVTHAPEGIEGGVWPSPPEGHSFVQLFIEVADVGAVADRAVALGAAILVPPQTLPDGDQLSILRGPEGVSFGLIKRKTAARP